MCGIAGLVNFSDPGPAGRRLSAMREALRHRGPDGQGEWVCPSAMLAHTRLAVIDVSGGGQPIANETGSAVLVCNGEIYNHHSLRGELESAGHVFRTASDSEVILHLYEEHPEDFPKYLRGMFAFAIYDGDKRELILGCDRLGQKPLFYEQSGAELAFASEIAALRDDRHALDLKAVHNFFALQYIPPPETVFLGVRRLLPAHLLRFSLDRRELRCRRYWRADFSQKSDMTADEAAGELRSVLSTAVARRLESEVPLGGFLSGGLDSAVVAALMLENTDRPVAFSSVGFDRAEYDETRNIGITADFLRRRYPGRVENRIFRLNFDDFSLLEKVAPFYGQPFADASMLPCYELSRLTREMGLTVTLSGDGADELFGGYERYVALEMVRRLRGLAPAARLWLRCGPDGRERTPAGRLRRFSAALAAPDRAYWSLISQDRLTSLREAMGEALLSAAPSDPAEILLRCNPLLSAADFPERASELDLLTYLPGDILTKVDIASMRSAQEVRSPFLDFDVAELACRMPWRFKQCGRGRKIIMRKAFADLVAPEVLAGRKRGFGVPVADLLRTAWRTKAEERILNGTMVKEGFFTRAGVDKLWRHHLSGKADESRNLFSLVIFELFLDNMRSGGIL